MFEVRKSDMCGGSAFPECLKEQKKKKSAWKTFLYKGFETLIFLLINISKLVVECWTAAQTLLLTKGKKISQKHELKSSCDVQ